MKIAVASGKGGTGKTLVAAHLARAASRAGHRVAYVDCDVESPNGHLLLKPRFAQSTPVGILVPRVDEGTCTHCGACGEICRYGAIVPLPQTTLVFGDLCHGCGGCALACPARAITEVRRATGRVEVGRAGSIAFVHGVLETGEPLSPPVIRAVGAAAPAADLLIVDAPPGTGCPVIESVRDADYVVLVAEPTPFGLHDLDLALELVRVLDLRCGVLINRAGVGDAETRAYCSARRIPILAELPEDRRIAEASSRGELWAGAAADFDVLLAAVLAQAQGRGR